MTTTEIIEYRIDRYPSTIGKRTKEGYLKVGGCVAVAGVLEYIYDGGEIVRELVPPETLKDPLNLDSMFMLPFCNLHPPVPVIAENWKLYAKGVVVPGTVYDDVLNQVNAEFVVYDAATIMDILEGGHDELSMGYEVGVDKTPGVHPVYGPYDQIQIWRKNNHVAAVPEARAGDRASFNKDSKSAVNQKTATLIKRLDAAEPQTQECTMSDQKVEMEINGIKWQFTPSQANAISTQMRADAADLKALRKELDAYKQDMEAVKNERDALDEQLKEMMAALDGIKELMAAEGMDLDAMVEAKNNGDMTPPPAVNQEDEMVEDLMGGFAEDGADKPRESEEERINRIANERAELRTMAIDMGFKRDSVDKATNAALKRAIVTARLGRNEVKGADETRIDSMFAVIKKQQVDSNNSFESFNIDGGGVMSPRAGDLEAQEAEAVKAYHDRVYGRSSN